MLRRKLVSNGLPAVIISGASRDLTLQSIAAASLGVNYAADFDPQTSTTSVNIIMATRKREHELEVSSVSKKPQPDMDPRMNPYLAHMYPEEWEDKSEENGYVNGYSFNSGPGRAGGAGYASVAFKKFKRHATTAALAAKAEDGPNNPFNEQPLSERYFTILKGRRQLPVHAQRQVQSLARI